MAALTLEALTAKLLAVVVSMTSYDLPETGPKLELLPRAELQKRLCKRPCPIFAIYQPGGSILMDDALDPVRNVDARSILLHELVHFAQWKRHGQGPQSCFDWRVREDEAYRVQFRWLNAQQRPARRLVRRRPPLPVVVCRAEGPASLPEAARVQAAR